MDDENHHPHWLSMSPVLVGLFGVLAGVIVVAICHCIITKCNTQRSSTSFTIFGSSRQGSNDSSESRVSSAVMEHSTIQVIVETKSTSKESGRDDVCAICLGEFKQGEEVRVLRECAHVFHVSCIDKWLVNHPNCPLCRAFAVPPSHFTADLSPAAPMNLNVV